VSNQEKGGNVKWLVINNIHNKLSLKEHPRTLFVIQRLSWTLYHTMMVLLLLLHT